MPSRSDHLLTLQAIDDSLARLGDEISHLETELGADPELDALKKVESRGRREARLAAERAATADQELNELTHRATRLEQRLYSGTVGNPAELMGMERELQVLKEKRATADENLLVVMEANDAADDEVLAAGQAVVARTALRASSRAPDERRLTEVRRELSETQDERVLLVAAIDAVDLDLYTRIASRLHPAVVGLAGDSCAGCHLPLGIQEARNVRAATEIVQCNNCDRILVP